MPPEFVYLGNGNGGEFMTLSRIDLTDAAGRVVPAYRMHIMGAHSKGKPYGTERIGKTTFKGIGIYVPPEFVRGRPELYAPPDPDEMLGQKARPDGQRLHAGVNGGELWVSLPHHSDDPRCFWIATIIPAIPD